MSQILNLKIMKIKNSRLLAVLLYCGLGTALSAQTTTTLTLNKDATVNSDPASTSTNYGNNVRLTSRTMTPNSVKRSLLDFDLSVLPQNVCITNAKLTLSPFIPSTTNTLFGNNSLIIKRITQPWLENTVTWNNKPNVDNQNSITTPASSNASTFQNIDVTDMIWDRYTNNSTTFGMCIELITEVPPRSAIFCSAEHPNVSYRPSLEVTYVTAPGYTITQSNPFANLCPSTPSITLLTNSNGYCESVTSDFWTFENDVTPISIGASLNNVTIPGTYYYTAIFPSGIVHKVPHFVAPCCPGLSTQHITLTEGVYSQGFNYGVSTNTGATSIVGDFLQIINANPTVKDIYVMGSIALAGYINPTVGSNSQPLILDGYNFYINGNCNTNDINTQIRLITCDAQFTNCTFQTVNCQCMWEGIEIWENVINPIIGEVGEYEFENCTFKDAEKAIKLITLGDLQFSSKTTTFLNNWEGIIVNKLPYTNSQYTINIQNNTFSSNQSAMLFPHANVYSYKHINYESGTSVSGSSLGTPLATSLISNIERNSFSNSEYGIYAKDINTANPTSFSEPIGFQAEINNNVFQNTFRAGIYSEPSTHKPSLLYLSENVFSFFPPPAGFSNINQYGVYSDHDLSIIACQFYGDYSQSSSHYIGVYHQTIFDVNSKIGDLKINSCQFNALEKAVSVMPTGFIDANNLVIASDLIEIRSNAIEDSEIGIELRENRIYKNYLSANLGAIFFSNFHTQNEIHCNEFTRTPAWKSGSIFTAIQINPDCWVGEIGNCSIEPAGNEINDPTFSMRSIWNQGKNMIRYNMYSNENMNNYASLFTYFNSCGIIAKNGTCRGSNGVLRKAKVDNSITKLNETNNLIQLYPNPSNSGLFNLDISGFKTGKTIHVINTAGLTIIRLNLNENQTKIDLSNYPKGLYFIKVSDGAHEEVSKIVFV